MHKMRKLAILAAAAAMFGAAGAAQAADSLTLQLKWVTQAQFAGYYVAQAKGFYKEAGFDIEIKPATGSGFVITAIDGGKADYGMADVSSVAQGVAKGAKVKGFMVYTDITTNGLAALSPYPTPESVVGKKIAAGQTDSVRVILPKGEAPGSFLKPKMSVGVLAYNRAFEYQDQDQPWE